MPSRTSLYHLERAHASAIGCPTKERGALPWLHGATSRDARQTRREHKPMCASSGERCPTSACDQTTKRCMTSHRKVSIKRSAASVTTTPDSLPFGTAKAHNP